MPNDPKLSHGHWKPGSACNLDFQISSAHPKTQGAVAVGSSAVLGQLASNLKLRSANRSLPLSNKNTAASARRSRIGASREPLELTKLCRIETEKSKSLAAEIIRQIFAAPMPPTGQIFRDTRCQKSGKNKNAASGITIQS